jgi:hypothetical protein
MSKRVFDCHPCFLNTAPLPRSFKNGFPHLPALKFHLLNNSIQRLASVLHGRRGDCENRDSTTKGYLYLRLGLLINFRTESCGQWTKDKNSVFRFSRPSSLVLSLFSGDGSFHVDLQGIKEGQRRTHVVMAKG